MPNLDFCEGSTSLNITIKDVTTSLEQGEKDRLFHLRLKSPSGEVVIGLDYIAVHAIALQCLARLPELVPEPKPAGFEDICKKPARVIADLDNRSIQFLLRSCLSDAMIDFLWYMQDDQINRRVFANCSKRCVSELKEDIDNRWREYNPDTAPPALVERGRKGMLSVIKSLQQLIGEGIVPDVLGATNNLTR